MNLDILSHWRRAFVWPALLPFCLLSALRAEANPTGGAVTQGQATILGQGTSMVNVNQTSANAFINWNGFDVGGNETVNFNQPSATSVTWNFINNPNAPAASTINGNINANGYVILQNPNGFTVGGSAAINAHGLIMTTASTPNLNLSGGGPWSFDAPPPAPQIINYGKINITGGGTAYLIANDVENDGAISAPGGKIGLYAGKQVLVSMSPDGRGLSAQTIIPQGLVDNNGNLIANAGSIALQAQMVNQNGLIQANSVQDVNGAIELVAGNAVNLGANSIISAQGDSQGVSSGGSVTIQGGSSFSDQAGSTINIAGGAQGGNGGSVSICAPEVDSLATSINGQAVNGYIDGVLTLDPQNIQLVSSGGTGTTTQYSTGTVNSSDPPNPGTLVLNVNNFSSSLSSINLQAINNIEVSTLWTLSPSTTSGAQLTLTAGNNIILDSGSGIVAGNNWTVNLTAGTAYSGTTAPASGNDGIYLNGNAYIQAANGNINLWAANEVQVGWSGAASKPGVANSGVGAIRTEGGGSISVTTEYGDINSGSDTAGFDWHASAPYYTPDINLGGISTADGGNVNISAGGNVVSFPTTTVAAGDPGTGAFGSSEPGDVTIYAAGNVYGNFVVMDGTGTIDAGHEIGTSSANVALSLAVGNWILNAGWDPTTQTIQNGVGDIYLQEVRNPNGIYNNTTVTVGRTPKPSLGNHLFDYNQYDSLTLNAGNSVDITGYEIPRPNGAVQLILPPTLIINAGAGGVILNQPTAISASSPSVADVTLYDSDITMYPSAEANLEITTTDGGGLTSGSANTPYLLMSDSGLDQWSAPSAANSNILPFGPQDHSSVLAELGNENPVTININGNMENVTLQVSKLAQINVDGDMIGSSFYGENLNPGDTTSINVKGQIYYATSFTSVTLSQAFPDIGLLSETLPSGESYLPPGVADFWYSFFENAVQNPATSGINNQSYANVPVTQLATDLKAYLAFGGFGPSSLEYNPATQVLTVTGPLTSDIYTDLETPYVYLPVYGANGYPLLDSSGHFVINKVTWMAPNTTTYTDPDLAEIDTLDSNSQTKPSLGSDGALIVGGTGYFNVSASSINLGNSEGILSVGNGGTPGKPFLGDVSYSYLTPYILSAPGATITVTTGTLEMPSSTIAALGGGDVYVTCNGVLPVSDQDPQNSSGVGVSMDLGSPNLADFEGEIMGYDNLGLGIYTAGGGSVNVTAVGTININTSRIATFDGGNVNITSLTGDVNAGSGSTVAIPINPFPLAATLPTPYEYVFADGIVADTLALEPNGSLVPGALTQPGNITVSTPQGSIYASLGGILQESLGENLLPGPYILLEAGTPVNGDWSSKASPIYVGNVELGNSGVIGGTVTVQATGKVSGLLISSQNANVTSQTVGGLTVLAAGTANVSAQSGSGGITIIGGQGVNASGVGSATLLGQNVSVNGAASQSTLGSSASSTSTSTSAAGQTSGAGQQQVAANGNGDDDKKKKKAQLRKVGRVTVILASAK